MYSKVGVVTVGRLRAWVLGINVQALGPQVLHHLQPPLAGCIVQRTHAALVLGCHVGARLQQLLHLRQRALRMRMVSSAGA